MELKEAFKILELNEYTFNLNLSILNESKKNQLKIYHPDKFRNEKLKKQAHEKTLKINEAYNVLKTYLLEYNQVHIKEAFVEILYKDNKYIFDFNSFKFTKNEEKSKFISNYKELKEYPNINNKLGEAISFLNFENIEKFIERNPNLNIDLLCSILRNISIHKVEAVLKEYDRNTLSENDWEKIIQIVPCIHLIHTKKINRKMILYTIQNYPFDVLNMKNEFRNPVLIKRAINRTPAILMLFKWTELISDINNSNMERFYAEDEIKTKDDILCFFNFLKKYPFLKDQAKKYNHQNVAIIKKIDPNLLEEYFEIYSDMFELNETNFNYRVY